MTASPAVAQVPASADASRFEDRFMTPLPQGNVDIERPKKVEAAGTIPEAEDGFVLKGVKLRGIKAFPKGKFQHLVDQYIGRTVDLDTLKHLAMRITQEYRKNGYFLSRAVVPSQEIDEENSTVIIQIIEGHVGDVIIDDEDGLLEKDSHRIIDNTIAELKRMQPLHGPTLERYMLLLNDAYGVTVQSVLQAPDPTKSEVGAVNVVLKIWEQKGALDLGYNNYGSRFVGANQFSTAWTKGNVFSAFDTLKIQANTAVPLSEVQFVSANYAVPLNGNGLKMFGTVSYSNSEPGHTLKALEVEGDSFSVNVGVSYPIIRSRRRDFTVNTKFTARNSATEFLDNELIDDKIRFFTAGVEYQSRDSWQGQNSFSLDVNQGVNILDSTNSGAAKLSRAGGRSNFFSIEGQVQRTQSLGSDFDVFGSVSGQYAPHPLLSSVEFGYGGASYGRAYDPSEITGDQGLAGAIELRYSGINYDEDSFFRFVPFAFYDHGKVWNEDVGGKPISASSAGFGAYYSMQNGLGGAAQLAWPLTKSVATPVMGGEDGPRALVGMNISF